MTKILILFRTVTSQLKSYISQIPLQLVVYAIILANNKLEKHAEDFWESFFFLLILVLPPFISLDEMSGAVVVICKNKSQMLKDSQRDTEWSSDTDDSVELASCYMRKVHPYHLGF